MEFTAEINIAKPIKEVILLFNNPLHLEFWNPDLQYREILKGKLGVQGCLAKVILKTPLLDLELEEELIKKDLPHSIINTYTASGIANTLEHQFKKTDDHNTHYLLKGTIQFENPMFENPIFNNPLTQMFNPIMSSPFEIQSKKLVQSFKEFCESNFYDKF
jgi:hypothetical protein